VKKNIVSLSTLALTLLSIASAGSMPSASVARPVVKAPVTKNFSECPPPLQVCAFESGETAR
jgi:hypothetical protein